MGLQRPQRRWPQRLGPTHLSWSFRAGLSSRVGALQAGTVGGTPQNQRDLVQVPANHLAAGCPACALICNMGAKLAPASLICYGAQETEQVEMPFTCELTSSSPTGSLRPIYRRGVSGAEGPCSEACDPFPGATWLAAAAGGRRPQSLRVPSKAAPLSTLSPSFYSSLRRPPPLPDPEPLRRERLRANSAEAAPGSAEASQ